MPNWCENDVTITLKIEKESDKEIVKECFSRIFDLTEYHYLDKEERGEKTFHKIEFNYRELDKFRCDYGFSGRYTINGSFEEILSKIDESEEEIEIDLCIESAWDQIEGEVEAISKLFTEKEIQNKVINLYFERGNDYSGVLEFENGEENKNLKMDAGLESQIILEREYGVDYKFEDLAYHRSEDDYHYLTDKAVEYIIENYDDIKKKGWIDVSELDFKFFRNVEDDLEIEVLGVIKLDKIITD